MNRAPDALPLWSFRRTDRDPDPAPASSISKAAAGKWFYFGVAVLFVLIAFVGFMPSYWLKVSNHTFDLPAIFHVHAALFFSWTLLNAMQAWFMATGRVYNHRRWGLLGISLATAMAISIVLLVITGIKMAEAHGMGLPARRFSYLSMNGVVKFAFFFGAAIVCVHRRELHKRLIVIANCTLMGAPIGRLVVMALTPPGAHLGPPSPVAIYLIMVLSYSPVLAGMILDWRTRGRPHPVYLLGVLSMATGLLVPIIGRTDIWITTIDHLVTLMG